MNSKQYVLKHNYGYGEEPERKNLNKLELRNVEDLKVWVKDLLYTTFAADVKYRKIYFEDGTVVKFNVRLVV